MRRLKFKFVWYDIWIGLFIDTNKKRLYLCPLPCCVIIYKYGNS